MFPEVSFPPEKSCNMVDFIKENDFVFEKIKYWQIFSRNV